MTKQGRTYHWKRGAASFGYEPHPDNTRSQTAHTLWHYVRPVMRAHLRRHA